MAASRFGVRELLEIFGAVDNAIKDSNRKDFASAVDHFLPQYSTHSGWYRELDQFLFPDDPHPDPDVTNALSKIVEYDTVTAKDGTDQRRLTQPQKARLLFILSTIARLNSVVPDGGLPKLTTEHKDLTIKALAAVGPSSFTRDTRLGIAKDRFDDFANGIPEHFTGRGDFQDLRQIALMGKMIGEQTAYAPICRAAIAKVDGFESVIVDTSFESKTVTLNNLKRVVNPYNWNANYPEFFLSMTNEGDAICPDGWRRVLETVRFFEGFELNTPLKYLPFVQDAGTARLDYDLDTSRFHSGDGRVRVDRGYINMTATEDPDEAGVRVHTRKVVHIEGISPFAQQRLVCITGYGTASSDFLLGRADPPPDASENFDYPIDEYEADRTPIDDTPISLGRHAVPTAVQVWADTLVDVSGQYADLAEKWWGGNLVAADIAAFGSRVGSRLAAAPLTFLDAVNRSRYRGK